MMNNSMSEYVCGVCGNVQFSRAGLRVGCMKCNSVMTEARQGIETKAMGPTEPSKPLSIESEGLNIKKGRPFKRGQ